MNEIDLDRYEKISIAFDEIKERYRNKLGQKDIDYIKGIRNKSRVFEFIGRSLILFFFDPFTFIIGVFFLFLHRNLEAIEIGHNVLHGQYDYFPEIPEFHSRNFKWKAPIDEEGWRREHNDMHHVYTNIYEKDPDLTHGILRTNDKLPWNKYHLIQFPVYLFYFYPFMMYKFNAQNLGFNKYFIEKNFPLGTTGYAQLNYKIDDGDYKKLRKRDFRTKFRIIFKEYYFFPLLALFTGFSMLRVFFANLIVDIAVSLWMTFTLQSTHFTAPLQDDNCLENKGKWYESQINSSVNFKGRYKFLSILWGHVNYQIEHHLFPDIPSHYYPELEFEVRKVCEKFNIEYKCNPTWGKAIRNYLKVFWKYSFKPKTV
ncbi:MAG: acyl-CoA desaturase [Candidatus Sericytochromatia bacterium]